MKIKIGQWSHYMDSSDYRFHFWCSRTTPSGERQYLHRDGFWHDMAEEEGKFASLAEVLEALGIEIACQYPFLDFSKQPDL